MERSEGLVAGRQGRGLEGEALAEHKASLSFRESLVSELAESLEGEPAWRGWDYWRVVTFGGFDPTMIREHWSLSDVWIASYQLRVQALLQAVD